MMAKANMKYGVSTKINGISVVYNDPDAPWPIRSNHLPTTAVGRSRSVETVLQVSNPDHADRKNRPRTAKLVSRDYYTRSPLGVWIHEVDHERHGSVRNHGRKPRHTDQHRETIRIAA